VVRDKEGKAYGVRYDQVNAMLLNEFLKEHKKVAEQGASITQLETAIARQETVIAQQRKDFARREAQIRAFRSGLERLRAQCGTNGPFSKTVANDQQITSELSMEDAFREDN